MPGLFLALALAASALVDVHPRALRLSEGGSIRVTVDVPGDGPLRLVASEGTVAQAGKGAFTVTPGSGRSPRLLLLAAFRDAPGAVPVFASVPLWGRARVPVQTDPHASVTAEIAGQPFGPFKADSAGKAVLTVEVPPGLEQGTSRAVAPGGTPVTRPLPLDPPPFRRLHAVVIEEDPAADGTLRARVVVGAAGDPPQPGRLKIAADRGKVGQVTEMPDGRLEATLELPRGKAGNVQMSISVAGERSSSFAVTASLRPAQPAALHIAAPDEVVAGATLSLSVSVIDQRGRSVPGPVPRLWAAGAEVKLSPQGPGVFAGPAPAPEQVGSLDLDASLDAPALLASRTLKVVPDHPASLQLGAASLRVAADGKAAIEFPAVVLGASGRKLDMAPTVTASLGKAEVVARPEGAVVRYQPPRIERPARAGPAELVARVGDSSARATVDLEAVAPPSSARGYLRLEGGGGGLGATGSGLELALAAGLPVARALRSAVVLELAGSRRTASSLSATALGLLVGLRGVAGPLEVEAAAGAGALWASASSDAGHFSSTLPALMGRLTLGMPAGPGAVVASVAYEGRLAQGALGPDAGTFPAGISLRGGYRLDLGP